MGFDPHFGTNPSAGYPEKAGSVYATVFRNTSVCVRERVCGEVCVCVDLHVT